MPVAQAPHWPHEPRRRSRRSLPLSCSSGSAGAAARGAAPDRLAARRARRLLRRLAHRPGRQHEPRRRWWSTSSARARGCSCSCGWSSSPTWCPTVTPCRRGWRRLDARRAGGGRLRSWSGSAGDASGFREAHDGADPPLAWLPATGLRRPRRGRPGAHGAAVLRGRVRGARPVAAVLGRRPAAAAVARLGSDQPALGTGARLGRALRTRRQPVGVDVALALAGSALPVTIGIAILRHRLFDIQLVLSRTLTYGVLVAAVVALYALLLFAANGCSGRQHGGRRARRRARRGGGAAGVLPCCGADRAVGLRLPLRPGGGPAEARREPGVRRPAPRRRDDHRLVADALKVDRVWVAAPDDAIPADPSAVQVAAGPPRRTRRRPRRGGAGGSPPLGGRHRAAPRPRPPCRGHRARRAAGRGAAGVAVADRHRPRGGAQATAPRACTTASGRPWPRSCSSSRPPGPDEDAERATLCWRRSATRPRPPSPRCDARSTSCAHRPSTRSGWPVRSANAPPRSRPTPWSSRCACRRRCRPCPPPSRSRRSGSPRRP